MGNEREGVLGRWSRLKRASAAPEENNTGLQEDAVAAGLQADHPIETCAGDPAETAACDLASEEVLPATDEEGTSSDGERMLSEEDLPDIDSLAYGSDFSAFLQKNVPEHLHRLALRKLWTSNPVLANVDGLNDYDLDYTISEMKEIAAQSAEDLARGVKRLNVSDLRSREREARREAAARSPTGAAQAATPVPVTEPGDEEREDTTTSAQLDPYEGGEAVTPPPRRTDA